METQQAQLPLSFPRLILCYSWFFMGATPLLLKKRKYLSFEVSVSASTASEYPLANFEIFRSLTRKFKIACWDSPKPLCRTEVQQRYGAYLRKMTIDGYIIYTDTADIRDQYVTALVRQLDLTAEQAETIFYFQLNGCLAINKKIYRNGSKNWEASRDLIGGFIQSGLKRYRK